MIAVTVIRDNVVDDITLFEDKTPEDRRRAEDYFLTRCGEVLSNWDEYTQDDKDATLDNGYETFGNGSICICTTENY